MSNAYPVDLNDQTYIGAAFQSFFRQSPQSIIIKADAPRFTILAVSDRFLAFSSRNRAEVINKPLFEAFPLKKNIDSERHIALDALNRVIKERRQVDLPVYKYELEEDQEGHRETLYWSNTNQPILDEYGEVAYIVNTTTNITDEITLKEIAELSCERLALQRQQLNNMFLKAPIGMAVYSKDNFIIEYANEAICRMWNKGEPDTTLGKSIFELMPDLIGHRQIFEKVVSTGHPFISKESPVTYSKNGITETYYFDLDFEPVYNENREVTGMLSLANDVTEKVLARRTIENAEERLRLASEATGIGSWDLDLQTRDLVYSPALADLFGFPGRTDLRHEELRATIHPEHVNLVEKAFRTALVTGKYSYKAKIIRPDHVIYWISVTGKVLFNAHNKPIRMLGTAIDITEGKQEELQKNDFIAIASHELKTPLTSLKAYAQLLKTGRSSVDPVFVVDLGERIEGQINKMTKLVYSFLDLSKIESSKMELVLEKTDLNKLIREVANGYVLQEYNHPLTFEPEELPLLFVDRAKIAQVMDNLISNAIKYSPHGGGIHVKASLENDKILVSVEDHGIGIDNNHRKKIFDRFYRVDDLQVKNASGFGIGLYLCADIIERHQGKIGLHSEPGKGSNFYFTLPVPD